MVKRPLRFIFDFDGTLTKKDTLHLVADVGYKKQKILRNGKTLPPWQSIVDAYIADYQNYAENYVPQPSERDRILSEANWLDGLQGVESASADRVSKAGVFNDVTIEDMDAAALKALHMGHVELRPGWANLLSKIEEIKIKAGGIVMDSEPLQIVSVNWSRWFVWSVVWHSACLLEDPILREQVQDVLKAASVYANEIDSIGSSAIPETISLPRPNGHSVTLRTAGDKLKHIRSKKLTNTVDLRPLQAYVGDSSTDLECLLMADVGICIRDQEMGSGQRDLEATALRIGIEIKHLDNYEHPSSSPQTLEELQMIMTLEQKILYYAKDFFEVERWLTRITSTV